METWGGGAASRHLSLAAIVIVAARNVRLRIVGQAFSLRPIFNRPWSLDILWHRSPDLCLALNTLGGSTVAQPSGCTWRLFGITAVRLEVEQNQLVAWIE
jgi:hypothetical protein